MTDQTEGVLVEGRRSLATRFFTRGFPGLTLARTEEADEDTWGPFGLTLLHEPSEPLIDFIFVHGLGGGSRKTWSKTASSAHYWPKAWLPNEPRFKNVRIHSFGYNSNWLKRRASRLTIHDFAQNLLADIQNSTSLNRHGNDTPIVLIGHSMGGIVIKKVLLLAKHNPSCNKIAARIHSLFFLATPHKGANIAKRLRSALELVAISHGKKAFVDGLIPNNEAIQMINDEFRHAYEGIQIWSFFETVPTALGLIVEKDSAVLGLPRENIQYLDADHSNVCKFESVSDSNYCRVRNAFISTIDSIEKEILPLSKTQERDTSLKMLSRFLGLSDVERPALDLANLIERQTKGSCSWLTAKYSFSQWQAGHQDLRLFWLKGKPGSGKSVLASHVINFLEKDEKICSYFFFKSGEMGKASVAELLRSLVWQMAAKNATILQKLTEMCDAGVAIEKNDERSIWRSIFTAIILRIELRQPQYWVIDALDECNYGSLFPLLAKLGKHFPLRIFVTSRPSLAIERLFSSQNIPMIAESVTLEDSQGDIKLFLEEHARYILVESEENHQQLVDIILAKSAGNFLWTTLVIKELQDAVSQEQIDNILASVPKGVDELYSQVFDNLINTSPNAPIAKAILIWTVLTSRPLLVEELKEALRLDIGQTLHQLAKTAGPICGNLVYVSESRVHIVHQTVREFLFHNDKDSELGVFESRGHSRIAEICLDYLSGDEMKPPRFRRASSITSHKTKRSPFADYAAIHFSDHAVRATTNVVQLAALNKFFKNNSLTWVEAIARTSDLTPLIHAVRNINIVLEMVVQSGSYISSEFQNVFEWTSDLTHLVQFGEILLANPGAIYHLIPSICPRQSMVFKARKNHPHGLQAVGLSYDHWDDRLGCIVIPGTKTLSVACKTTKLALGTSNGKVYIYHETTLQEELQLVHGEPVRHLKFAATNAYLASSGRRKINYWNTYTGELLWSIPTDAEILALEFNEDILMAATTRNDVKMWDTQNGDEVKNFRVSDRDEEEKKEHCHRSSPSQAKFSTGLGILGVVYRNRPVSLWDLEDNEFVGQFHRNQSNELEPYIHDFIINPNPDLNLAAVSYHDGLTVVFDPETQEARAEVDTDATVLAASPDGTVLATGSGNGVIKLYDFETMKLFHQVSSYQENIRAIEFNSSGRRFFEIRGDYCNVWEPSVLVRGIRSADGSSVKALEPPLLSIPVTFENDLTIAAIAAHHEGDLIFCGRENGTVAAYATKTGLAVQELFKICPNVAVDFLQWNPRENLLASADRSGRFVIRRVINISPGPFQISEPILDGNHSSVVHQIVLNADGKRFLVSTPDFDALWNLDKACIVQKLMVSEARSSWKWASHPELDRLLLFIDGRVRVFEWNSLQELSTEGGIDLGTRQLSVTDIIFSSHARNFWVLHSSIPGSALPPSLQLWPSQILSPENERLFEALSRDSLAKEIKFVIGVYKSWLVFLGHSGWVCSIDTTVYETHYIRHFFIPRRWHSANGGSNHMVVTRRGSIVMAVQTEIAVFHNGLDFEEKVNIPD